MSYLIQQDNIKQFIHISRLLSFPCNNNNNRTIQVTYDNREKAFLYQRLSVLIQRYNAVTILGTFAHTTPEDEI